MLKAFNKIGLMVVAATALAVGGVNIANAAGASSYPLKK